MVNISINIGIPKQPQTNPRKIRPSARNVKKWHISTGGNWTTQSLLCSKLALKRALRRLFENLVWGRMGLVYATVSRRMALAPPLHHSIEQNYFRLHPIRWKLNNHPIFWTVVQSVLSIKRWNKLMEASDCARYMRLCDRRSVFEYCSVIGQFCPIVGQFLPNRSTKTSSCKRLKSLRFSRFVEFASTNLSDLVDKNVHKQFWCQFSPKIFSPKAQ